MELAVVGCFAGSSDWPDAVLDLEYNFGVGGRRYGWLSLKADKGIKSGKGILVFSAVGKAEKSVLEVRKRSETKEPWENSPPWSCSQNLMVAYCVAALCLSSQDQTDG